MNYKNVIVKIVVLLLVFGLGAVVGGYFGFKKVGEPMQSLNTLLTVATNSQYACLQYQNAQYSEAKKALLDYLSLLKELNDKGLVKDRYDQRMYNVESGLTYARLALLEEKAGNITEKQKAMEDASKRFQLAGWKDYSESKIREVLKRIDEG